MPARKGNAVVNTVFAVAVTGLFIGILWAVGGNVLQTTRNTMTAGDPGYVLADTSLNMTMQSASFGKTTGLMIGVIILVGIGLVGLVVLLMYLVKSVGKGSGGGKGRRFGG